MKCLYLRLRIGLMAFALGLAGVYWWNGISIALDDVSVDLPKASEEVLYTFPASSRDASPYYIPTNEEIIGGRDLSNYDIAGYVQVCDGPGEQTECLRKRDAARHFVFDHLKEKRRGYIEIGLPCVDCAPVDHIFVEPDARGDWQVAITLETNGPPTTDTATSLRFKPATEEEQWHTESKTVLLFLDRNGKPVNYF